MANRAYLHSSDCSDLKSINLDCGYYLDSRHFLPLSWIFLFTPESFQTVEVECGSDTCFDGYFSATKEHCRSNWLARYAFFCSTLSYLGISPAVGSLDKFFLYPGTTVILDYHELDFMENYTVEDFSAILEAIDSGDREKFVAYISKLSDLSPKDPQLAIYGANYDQAEQPVDSNPH